MKTFIIFTMLVTVVTMMAGYFLFIISLYIYDTIDGIFQRASNCSNHLKNLSRPKQTKQTKQERYADYFNEIDQLIPDEYLNRCPTENNGKIENSKNKEKK